MVGTVCYDETVRTADAEVGPARAREAGSLCAGSEGASECGEWTDIVKGSESNNSGRHTRRPFRVECRGRTASTFSMVEEARERVADHVRKGWAEGAEHRIVDRRSRKVMQ
jgi:hypothetical protein